MRKSEFIRGEPLIIRGGSGKIERKKLQTSSLNNNFAHSHISIPFGIGIPSGIPNLDWNPKMNTDSNWNSMLNG